jgi:arginyl-tRNA synthetase
LKIALGLLGSKVLPESIFYSFVSLAEGKMSTRKAQVVYLDDLIHESLQRAYEEVARRRPMLDSEQKKRIGLEVGLGSIRYNIIRVQADKRIVFRWEEALNFEGDSSPFLQYAHARCCGILDKANYQNYETPSADDVEKMAGDDFVMGIHDNERNLIRILADFPDRIEVAGLGYRPHFIPKYLQDLASAFNNFYQSCPVISGTDENIKRFRLGLVECTRIVLAEGLDLLGITAPESM